MERSDQAGFGLALLGHAAILALLTWVVVPRSPPPTPAPIEVSFVDEVGLVSAAPQPAAPSAAAAAPDVGPTEDAAAASSPAPSLPEPSPRVPDPRPTPPQPRTIPKQTTPSPRAAGSGERTQRQRIGSELLEGLGNDPAAPPRSSPPATVPGEARASINAAIRRALVPCERQPLPAPEAGAIRVDVRVVLNRDGSLADATVVRVHNDNPGLGIYERRMRDLAVAIVRGCTPIRGLPAQYYDVPRGWRQFVYQFDPRQGR